VQRAQALRVEPRDAGAAGLDRRADALEQDQQPLPLVRHPRRVGRDEPQGGAAGERLPQPQAGAHAVGLGGGGGLADQLLASRLRGQRDGPGGQGLAAAGGDRELETGDLGADDQDEHMFAHRSDVENRLGTAGDPPKDRSRARLMARAWRQAFGNGTSSKPLGTSNPRHGGETGTGGIYRKGPRFQGPFP
jgi:hypothetical protein